MFTFEKIYYKIIIINRQTENNIQKYKCYKERTEIRSAYGYKEKIEDRMISIFLFPLLYITVIIIAEVVHLIFSSNNV